MKFQVRLLFGSHSSLLYREGDTLEDAIDNVMNDKKLKPESAKRITFEPNVPTTPSGKEITI